VLVPGEPLSSSCRGRNLNLIHVHHTCVKGSSYSLLLEAVSFKEATAGKTRCKWSPRAHACKRPGWCACCVLACSKQGSPGPMLRVLNCVARAWCQGRHVRRSLALPAGLQCWVMACSSDTPRTGLSGGLRLVPAAAGPRKYTAALQLLGLIIG